MKEEEEGKAEAELMSAPPGARSSPIECARVAGSVSWPGRGTSSRQERGQTNHMSSQRRQWWDENWQGRRETSSDDFNLHGARMMHPFELLSARPQRVSEAVRARLSATKFS